METKQLRDVYFDHDDVLVLLQDTAAEMTGIPLALLDEFDTPRNTHLTEKQKQAVIGVYCDPWIFAQMPYLPGIEDLLRPERYGARIFIKSDSLSKNIADIKRERLLSVVPGLRPEQLILPVISPNEIKNKHYPREAFVAVDDNPYVASKSLSRHMIVPTASHNTSVKAENLLRQREIIRTPHGDLHTIIDKVCELLQTDP